MPWKGVTVSEQRMMILEDFKMNYCSVTDLAEGIVISRKPIYLQSTGSKGLVW